MSRVLYQADLASGSRTYDQDSMFFLRMRDEQLRETSDLSAVYYLLRRNPCLVGTLL